MDVRLQEFSTRWPRRHRYVHEVKFWCRWTPSDPPRITRPGGKLRPVLSARRGSSRRKDQSALAPLPSGLGDLRCRCGDLPPHIFHFFPRESSRTLLSLLSLSLSPSLYPGAERALSDGAPVRAGSLVQSGVQGALRSKHTERILPPGRLIPGVLEGSKRAEGWTS